MAEAKAWVMMANLNKDKTGCELEMYPLVLCKDCKYHFVDGDNVHFNMCLLNHNRVQSDDWYCADGERKEGR